MMELVGTPAGTKCGAIENVTVALGGLTYTARVREFEDLDQQA